MKFFLSFLLCFLLLTSISFGDSLVSVPDASDPGVPDPVVSDPAVSDPGVSDPGVFDPGVSDPGVSDPGVSDPGVSDPGVSDPGVSDPGLSADGDLDSLTVTANEVNLYSLLPEEDQYPSGAPLQGGVYMKLDTSELGEVLVYVPVNYQYDSFTQNSNGQPVNITASTITGYSYDGNDYNIRWQSWGVPMYRPVNGGVSYQVLTVNDIISSNVGFWSEGGVSYNYMLFYICIAALILLLAFLIIRK